MAARYFIIIFFAFIRPVLCSSQNNNNGDSLLNAAIQIDMRTAKHDTTRILLYLETGDFYEYSAPDTALMYYNKALALAVKIQDTKLSAKCYCYIGIIYFETGEFQSAIEHYYKSLELYEKLKRSDNEIISRAGKQGTAIVYANLGAVYEHLGNYPKSLEFYQKALKIYESLGDIRRKPNCLSGIGIVHHKQGYYSTSFDYFKKALEIYENTGDQGGISNCYNNIGIVCKDMKNFPLAIEYYEKALKIFEEYGLKKRIAQSLINVGVVYYEQGKHCIASEKTNCTQFFQRAVDNYNKSIGIYQEIGDKEGMALVNENIASVFLETGNYGEAEKHSLKSLDLAKETGSLEIERSCYSTLALTNSKTGNYKKAFEYQESYKLLNDSIFNLESSRQLKQMEAKYQSEKKQLEIDNLTKDKTLKESDLARKKEEIRNQRLIIYMFIFGTIIILVFSVITYKQFLDKKKAYIRLAAQNIEIQQKNDEISTQRDEIQAQRDIVVFQKNELEDIHKQLTDSIHYAKRIQSAVLPTNQQFIAVLSDMGNYISRPEFFLIYKPKNIVSGDFYFVNRRNEWILTAVADCTGHGVPGAFMSMLGIAFLNEIIAKEDIKTAGQVLDRMREYIIKSLHQKNMVPKEQSVPDNIRYINKVYYADDSEHQLPMAAEPETGYKIQKRATGSFNKNDADSLKINRNKDLCAPREIILPVNSDVKNMPSQISSASAVMDGMDISFVAINTKTGIMQFAGANNPVYIVNTDCNQSHIIDSNELTELKGDKMPISIHVKMDNFSNKEVQVKKGTIIYLFSDGFSDQFGGEKGKKFMSGNFKQKIREISALSMAEQKDQLEKTLNGWMKPDGKIYEQTDDITVIGIKI